MSKAERTRTYIIERSALVFNHKGYAGTSLADLVEATGLTKGSIYGNFENKNAVAVAAYDYNIDFMRREFASVMIPQPTAEGKLIALTEYYRQNWRKFFARGGCPIQNASIETDDAADLMELREHVQASVRMWAKDIGAIIGKGQRTGEFRAEIDAQAYAYEILIILEGGIMIAKILDHPKQLYVALDRIVAIIQQELKA
jgi:TetR/AcrR family transcriptional regulator, transcriptional repressor for nem operon